MFKRKQPPEPGKTQQQSQQSAGGHQPGGHDARRPSRPDPNAVVGRQPTPPAVPDAPRRTADLVPGRRSSGQSEKRSPEEGQRLIVGRNISLSGEIKTCERLVVEGQVDAELTDSQSLEITDTGLFKGKAVIDEAEIAGRFEGELEVRRRLYIRASGRVSGKIRYSDLEIERGGRIAGSVEEIDGDAVEPAYNAEDAGEMSQTLATTTGDSESAGQPGAAEASESPQTEESPPESGASTDASRTNGAAEGGMGDRESAGETTKATAPSGRG